MAGALGLSAGVDGVEPVGVLAAAGAPIEAVATELARATSAIGLLVLPALSRLPRRPESGPRFARLPRLRPPTMLLSALPMPPVPPRMLVRSPRIWSPSGRTWTEPTLVLASAWNWPPVSGWTIEFEVTSVVLTSELRPRFWPLSRPPSSPFGPSRPPRRPLRLVRPPRRPPLPRMPDSRPPLLPRRPRTEPPELPPVMPLRTPPTTGTLPVRPPRPASSPPLPRTPPSRPLPPVRPPRRPPPVPPVRLPRTPWTTLPSGRPPSSPLAAPPLLAGLPTMPESRLPTMGRPLVVFRRPARRPLGPSRSPSEPPAPRMLPRFGSDRLGVTARLVVLLSADARAPAMPAAWASWLVTASAWYGARFSWRGAPAGVAMTEEAAVGAFGTPGTL